MEELRSTEILDKEIPKDVIKEIQALDNVYEAIGLEL